MFQSKKSNQSNAFVSFDAIFTILPLLLMVLYVLNVGSFISSKNSESIIRQQTFNKVVSVADYIVKNRAAKTTGSTFSKKLHPNWIDENELKAVDGFALAKAVGLTTLSITLDYPTDNNYCIYRIVVTGTSKQIRKLYVCGG